MRALGHKHSDHDHDCTPGKTHRNIVLWLTRASHGAYGPQRAQCPTLVGNQVLMIVNASLLFVITSMECGGLLYQGFKDLSARNVSDLHDLEMKTHSIQGH